jgi:NADH-quinone oxidoreductase subunit J
MTVLFFSYFSFIIILTAILVIALRNPVHSFLSLLVMFLHVAGIYFLLNAEFIGIIQIFVYAGAILVLYLFALMLLNLKQEEGYQRQLAIGLLLGLAIVAEVVYAVVRSSFGGAGQPVSVVGAPAGNTESIGRLLYTVYLFPFEVASILLLVAMIGAIILAKRGVFDSAGPAEAPEEG